VLRRYQYSAHLIAEDGKELKMVFDDTEKAVIYARMHGLRIIRVHRADYLSDSLQVRFRLLKFLGLTQSEARLYLALVRLGPSEYRSLIVETGIGYRKIHSLLKNLVSKGFVESNEDRPKTFMAVDPSKVLSQSVEELSNSALHEIVEEYRRAYSTSLIR